MSVAVDVVQQTVIGLLVDRSQQIHDQYIGMVIDAKRFAKAAHVERNRAEPARRDFKSIVFDMIDGILRRLRAADIQLTSQTGFGDINRQRRSSR